MLAMEKTRKTKENSQSNKRVSILAEAADSQAKGDYNHHLKLGWFRRPVTNYPRCRSQKIIGNILLEKFILRYKIETETTECVKSNNHNEIQI